MTNNQKAELIVNYFNEILPTASCELDYKTDYGLLISVVLSAQTTDKSVNKVTPILFSISCKIYSTPLVVNFSPRLFKKT